MMGGGRLHLVLSLSFLCSALCVVMPSSCASDLSPEIGQASSLLQVSQHTNAAVSSHTDKANAASVEEVENEDEADARAQQVSSWLKLSQSATSSNKNPPHKLLPAKKGQARAILEPSLFDVGVQLLGSEDSLDVVVANTGLVDVPFSGEMLHMRLVVGDGGGAGDLLGFGMDSEDEYGLNSLGTLEPNALGMLEMMDVGANVGAVSIAAFKKQGKRLRIVAVEPNPSTYFLFLWNLFLNGVPQLSLQTFHDNPTQAGVLAINKGVASTDNQVVDLCYTPPQTMMARICNCSVQTGVGAFQPGIEQCANVVSSTFDSLLGYFLNGSSQLTYLKVDCEGCENDLLPALSRYAANPAWKLGRLAGELHRGVENAVEDITCQFEGGKWLVHICATKERGRFVTPVAERCRMGANRVSCTYP